MFWGPPPAPPWLCVASVNMYGRIPINLIGSGCKIHVPALHWPHCVTRVLEVSSAAQWTAALHSGVCLETQSLNQPPPPLPACLPARPACLNGDGSGTMKVAIDVIVPVWTINLSVGHPDRLQYYRVATSSVSLHRSIIRHSVIPLHQTSFSVYNLEFNSL